MELMEPDIAQLGGVVVVAIAFIELLKYVIGKFVPNATQRQSDTLDTIADNHLNHIEAAVREQTVHNDSWHEKQFEILVEIKSILGERR